MLSTLYMIVIWFFINHNASQYWFSLSCFMYDYVLFIVLVQLACNRVDCTSLYYRSSNTNNDWFFIGIVQTGVFPCYLMFDASGKCISCSIVKCSLEFWVVIWNLICQICKCLWLDYCDHFSVVSFVIVFW